MLLKTKSSARKRSSDSVLAATASPDPDRARALARILTADVRSAGWAFARFDADGEMCEFLHEPERPAPPLTPDSLSTETALQARDGARAPLVAPSKITIAPYRFGLTIIYGYRARPTGILVLLRHAADGPFTSADRGIMAAKLQVASEDLRCLSIYEGEEAARSYVVQRSSPAQFVLNDRFEIVWRWTPRGGDEVLDTMLCGYQLPPAIDRVVREAVMSWRDDPETWTEHVSLALPFVVVRISPLTNAGRERRIGVLVERYQSRNAMRAAIKKYGLSRREVEVLSLLLQGRGSTEIAQSLGIAESTVNDHIKRLLTKANARNRVDLAAKVLGWRAV